MRSPWQQNLLLLLERANQCLSEREGDKRGLWAISSLSGPLLLSEMMVSCLYPKLEEAPAFSRCTQTLRVPAGIREPPRGTGHTQLFVLTCSPSVEWQAAPVRSECRTAFPGVRPGASDPHSRVLGSGGSPGSWCGWWVREDGWVRTGSCG